MSEVQSGTASGLTVQDVKTQKCILICSLVPLFASHTTQVVTQQDEALQVMRRRVKFVARGQASKLLFFHQKFILILLGSSLVKQSLASSLLPLLVD